MAAFQELALDPRLLRSIQHLGFTQPTEIQQEAIPAVMHSLTISHMITVYLNS